MLELDIQELLHDFVDNEGKNVTEEKVKPFLRDPKPLKRRIAHELMYNLTGDANYLLKCIPVIKDNADTLWEFLFDYTSEINDPYIISLLMIEGLTHIDPINDLEKAQSLVYNWRKINPCFTILPDDNEKLQKVKVIHYKSLPVIANVFVNWILMGIKNIPFFEFDYFPYFLANHSGHKSTLPVYAIEAIKALPDEYKANYEMGVLSVFQYDIISANEYFIRASEVLLKQDKAADAYNLLTMWYKQSGDFIKKYPELLAEIEEVVWKLVHDICDSQLDAAHLLIMSVFLYCEVVSSLVYTKHFKYERLIELSKMYEKKIEYFKTSLNITFNSEHVQKDKINVGFMALSINKGPVGSVFMDYIKHHNTDKFNLFFYDCGLVPNVSYMNSKELEDYATVRALKVQNKKNKLEDIINFADQIRQDNIDIMIYQDWLYNSIGHALCCMDIAPVIVSTNLASISTGLSKALYMMDYLGMYSDNGPDVTEKLVKMPVAFPALETVRGVSPRNKYGIPEQVVLLYSFNNLKHLDEDYFKHTVAEILEANFDVHFAFSGNGDKNSILNYFDNCNLLERVHYLGANAYKELNMSFIEMSDIYLDTFSNSRGAEVYYAMLAQRPVVTMKGFKNNLFINNNGAAVVELKECIANSTEEYVGIASEFIQSEELREQVSQKLKQRAESEFNMEAVISAHEEFYMKLYNEFCTKSN